MSDIRDIALGSTLTIYGKTYDGNGCLTVADAAPVINLQRGNTTVLGNITMIAGPYPGTYFGNITIPSAGGNLSAGQMTLLNMAATVQGNHSIETVAHLRIVPTEITTGQPVVTINGGNAGNITGNPIVILGNFTHGGTNATFQGNISGYFGNPTFVIAKTTNITGFNDVSQSNIRTALGMNGATFDDDMAMVKNIGILAMRKDAGFASDLESSIGLVSYVNRDTNSGAGSFDNTTDSEQAIRDNHPANFSTLAITAGGCTTVGTNADKTGYTGNVTDKSGFALSATGLNALTLTEPTSTDRTSWTFVQHVLAIGLRMFGRRERIGNDTSGLLKTLNTGNTVIGNQTYSAVSNGNETIGNST